MKLALTTAIALTSCAPAYAQQCIPTELAHSTMDTAGFQRATSAMSGPMIIETWAKLDGEFIMFYTTVEGISCILLTGTDFETYPRGIDG